MEKKSVQYMQLGFDGLLSCCFAGGTVFNPARNRLIPQSFVPFSTLHSPFSSKDCHF